MATAATPYPSIRVTFGPSPRYSLLSVARPLIQSPNIPRTR